jgi:putative toxin-antitoxin system antitoxin component (TIGR02293 family)
MPPSKPRKKSAQSSSRRLKGLGRGAASGLSSYDSKPIAQQINRVREGLPIYDLNAVASTLHISREQLANILGVTTRTLQRKAEADDRLSPLASDRLARVQRILELATEVLGDQEKAARWMTTASRPLEGELPLHLLDTDIGTQRVEQELYQIKYGIPA